MKYLRVYYWYLKTPQCEYMEHGWKHINCYVQKHIVPQPVCYNPPLVHDKSLGASSFVRWDYYMIARVPVEQPSSNTTWGCTEECYHNKNNTNHNAMTSSNGNFFNVTDPLCGVFTGHRWIPLTKASDAVFLISSLICTWINAWVNNHEAGDLRCHHTHYDVILMQQNDVCVLHNLDSF